MHARVRGETPDGRSYRALEPELMNWVQATASFGFLQAYHRFVAPLSAADRNRLYAEAQASARLYGAPGAPADEAQQQALFENTARAMGDARIEVKQRHIAKCAKADPAYGAGVAKALGLAPTEVAAE